MISQSELKAALSYDADTGVFLWRISPCPPVKVGQVAGAKGPKGSWRIEFCEKNYLAHRLAWFYVHGEWPEQIDHINGNRADNRLCNLRPADNSQNQANMGPKKNSHLGIRGVGFRNGSYIVQLRKGTEYVRRRFATLAAAQEFAVTESKRLHGEFSVHARVAAR
jgi:hypothetical protein